jgi:hypothetical protein
MKRAGTQHYPCGVGEQVAVIATHLAQFHALLNWLPDVACKLQGGVHCGCSVQRRQCGV